MVTVISPVPTRSSPCLPSALAWEEEMKGVLLVGQSSLLGRGGLRKCSSFSSSLGMAVWSTPAAQPRIPELCTFLRDSGCRPCRAGQGLSFPEISCAPGEPARPGPGADCSRGREGGLLLSQGKSPLVFASLKPTQGDLSGGLGGAGSRNCTSKDPLGSLTNGNRSRATGAPDVV